ncbi:hypothetical protein SELMODRAFT_409996 [Selaginella moellendorffii]|uniref:ABC transporter domain-containing protein n=1 Tax=Selaginella moellendorffii TaxID=88036 RepID=D8RD47_SELML|nr:hypothetical protein SELMODRAFT_409996 [Selaginella moellendorffii]
MDHTEVAPGYDAIGKKLLGCLLGVCIKLARSKIKVLKDVSGYVMPGSMTLVLSSPGSGKSTLLKTVVITGDVRKATSQQTTQAGLSSRLAIKWPITYVTQHEQRSEKLSSLFPMAALYATVRCRDSYEDYILYMFGLIKIGLALLLMASRMATETDWQRDCYGFISLVQISPEFFDLFDRVILLRERSRPTSMRRELLLEAWNMVDAGTFYRLLQLARVDSIPIVPCPYWHIIFCLKNHHSMQMNFEIKSGSHFHLWIESKRETMNQENLRTGRAHASLAREPKETRKL